MATCLVTGGAGFVGSHLVERLVEEGEEVVVLDNFSTGKMENIQHLIGKVKLIEGDIRDCEVVRTAIKGVQYVFHQAALRSVPMSVNDPGSFNEVNVSGTLNLLLAARAANAKRVVFASSSSVYGGDIEAGCLLREDMRLQPISPYAASKAAAEFYCHVFTKLYGLETVTLRYFNVFGARQDPHSSYAAVVPAFIVKSLMDQSPIIFGDGLQSRDFTHVGNVVIANLNAARLPGIGGMIFNVACGKQYTLLQLLDIINRLLGKQVKPLFFPPREGDVRHTLADITLAKKHLGMDKLVDFEEGLKTTIQQFECVSK